MRSSAWCSSASRPNGKSSSARRVGPAGAVVVTEHQPVGPLVDQLVAAAVQGGRDVAERLGHRGRGRDLQLPLVGERPGADAAHGGQRLRGRPGRRAGTAGGQRRVGRRQVRHEVGQLGHRAGGVGLLAALVELVDASAARRDACSRSWVTVSSRSASDARRSYTPQWKHAAPAAWDDLARSDGEEGPGHGRRRDAVQLVRGGVRPASLGRARALQHRPGRLRQAPPGQARDDPRALRGRRCARSAGASCRRSATASPTSCAPAAWRRAIAWPCSSRRRPRPPRRSSAPGSAAAILLSMSVLYGDDGIRHRVKDSEAKVLVTDRANAGRIPEGMVEHVVLLDDDGLLDGCDDTFEAEDTLADDPGQLYYSSGTTGLAKGILHAHRYLLAHEEFVYCHDVQEGELFHGMGEWAWAAGIAPLLGPWRLGAVQLVYQREGGFDPHKQLDVLSRHGATNVFTTPTAMRSMMGIGDAGTRYPQRFRVVCSAGEPLNPEAIRWFRSHYGVTVLDYYGLDGVLSARRQLPVHGGAGGVDGQADARLGDRHPRRGRAAGGGRRARRDLPARAVEPALSARLLAQRGGRAGDVRRRLVPHQGRRQGRRGRLRLVRGPRGRRDHRGGLPDRPVRGRVRLPRASRPWPRRPPWPRRTSAAATSSRPSSSWPATPSRATSWRTTSSASCASGSARTRTRAGSSSSTGCPRRSRARSGGSSCASRRWTAG